MPAIISVPSAFAKYTGGAVRVEVNASTVGEALDGLCLQYPELRERIFNRAGALQPFVCAFVNDADSRSLGGPAAPLRDGDVLCLVPAIAGG